MKKKLIVLSIVGLMALGGITYAEENSSKNIEQSNIYLEEARTYIRKYDNNNAEVKLIEAIKLNNKNAEAYHELGRIEWQKNSNDKAISYFNKAIKIDPSNDTYYVSRAGVEIMKAQYSSLINDLNKALEINPKNGSAYLLLAGFYSMVGHEKEALDNFNKAELYDESIKGMLYQGRALSKIQLNDYDGAIADYYKDIEYAKNCNDEGRIKFDKQKIKELEEIKKIFK